MMTTVAGTSVATGSGSGRRALPLLVAAAMTYAVLAVALATASVSAHATRSPLVLSATLTAAVALLVGGCAAVLSSRYAAPGTASLVVGAVWLGSSLVGWLGGPAWVRAIALVATAFLPALILHLVLLVPGPRPPENVRRTVTATAYGVTGAVTAVTVLTRDPLRDPYCWHDCNLRILAVLPDRAVADLASSSGLVVVVALTGLAAVLAVARSTGAQSMPVSGLLVSGPAVLLGVGWAAAAVAVLAGRRERPSDAWFQVAHSVQVLAVLLLGLGLILLELRRRRRRVALQRLSARVDAIPPVGSLERHLARALDDPGLQVAHWLPRSQCFVDSAGARVTPPVDDARTRAELRRGEELLAVVTLDRPQPDDDLGSQIGAATRLALDNERHHAEVQAQIAELRRSRERIVEAADASRRALERDLHDGIQAELVALLIEAGRALEQARRSGDRPRVGTLEETVDRISSAVARLRDITHGIYPAELAEEGLEAALWTLTDEARIPVTVDVDLRLRPSAPVDQASYLVAVEALALATGPEPLRLRVRGSGETVVVQVEPIGRPAPESLTDRIGALDGTLTWTGRRWEVVLPCGSS